MNLRQNEPTWAVPAPAKLNLYLDVLGRRNDGFHELETLMAPVQLYDSLAFTPIPRLPSGLPAPINLQLVEPRGFQSTKAAEVPTGAGNLVVRALELFRQRSGCEQGARVMLVKRIPSAAG